MQLAFVPAVTSSDVNEVISSLRCKAHAVLCRRFHGAIRHQLLLPLVWHQRVNDDLHALSLQRPQYLRLELPGCGHH